MRSETQSLTVEKKPGADTLRASTLRATKHVAKIALIVLLLVATAVVLYVAS